MGDSFKYQLIQTSRLTTVEDRNARTIYKIILACTGLILTILYYNMPIPETELAIIEFDVRSTVPQAIEPKIKEDASNTTIGKTDMTLITLSILYHCQQDSLKLRTISSTPRDVICSK